VIFVCTPSLLLRGRVGTENPKVIRPGSAVHSRLPDNAQLDAQIRCSTSSPPRHLPIMDKAWTRSCKMSDRHINMQVRRPFACAPLAQTAERLHGKYSRLSAVHKAVLQVAAERNGKSYKA